MKNWYLVRTGALGHVGRYDAPDHSYTRMARVVVRGGMGLQLGQVLACVTMADDKPMGTIIRPATPEDELLAGRLERRRQEAIMACQAEMTSRNISAVLLDAEYALDGSRIGFYFLGDLPEGSNSLVDSLAELYGVQVQLESFAKTLSEGCGPDCGLSEGGCGSDSCVACHLVQSCKKEPQAAN